MSNNAPTPHYLFITGHLAEKSLARVLATLAPVQFTVEIRVLGVSVAALLTGEMIKRRLGTVDQITRVIIPGRCTGDLVELSAHFGVPFARGPDELKDLPQFFGAQARTRDLSRNNCLIFAEIVDTPHLSVAACLLRATRYRHDGADVIDLGCLPGVPFPHLADCVQALKAAGCRVSVDSLQEQELLEGGRAGADYLFSLSEDTLWITDEVPSVPILIGREPRDLESLGRAIETMQQRGKTFLADPILDPIHHGFTESILRYHALRARYPQAPLMMGIGNLSELTHADTLGVNTLMMGIVSELQIAAILTTEVSGHCKTVVREVDHARRVMFAAHDEGTTPRHLDEGLLALHDRRPFPYSADEIADFAREVKDSNFRIQVAADGIHVYNRDGRHLGTDPYDLFPLLNVNNDAPHAFYLGLELARAQVAWQLGKRYAQDEELAWGCVRPRPTADRTHFAAERSTLQARKAARKTKKPEPDS